MIRHKDGTMTGTPAEMIEYERLQKGEKPVFRTPLERMGEKQKDSEFTADVIYEGKLSKRQREDIYTANLRDWGAS